MRSFFPIPRGDLLTIVGLLLFALLSFLPVTREVELGGMALLGWLMAALMVASPLLALWRLRRRRRGPSGP